MRFFWEKELILKGKDTKSEIRCLVTLEAVTFENGVLLRVEHTIDKPTFYYLSSAALFPRLKKCPLTNKSGEFKYVNLIELDDDLVNALSTQDDYFCEDRAEIEKATQNFSWRTHKFGKAVKVPWVSREINLIMVAISFFALTYSLLKPYEYPSVKYAVISMHLFTLLTHCYTAHTKKPFQFHNRFFQPAERQEQIRENEQLLRHAG